MCILVSSKHRFKSLNCFYFLKHNSIMFQNIDFIHSLLTTQQYFNLKNDK